MIFQAIRSTKENKNILSELIQRSREDLDPGSVLVRVHYSGINYKDALGVTGQGKIFRKFPIQGGIDFSGEVVESHDKNFSVGDCVLVNGCNYGEERDGGFGEYVMAEPEFLIPIPEGLDVKSAMVLGTAGFTAALAIHRMLANAQSKEMGPVLVTGATGGVGGFAIQILSQLGFEVYAASGKKEKWDWLKSIGASHCLDPEEIKIPSKYLDSVSYAGVIDNIGGDFVSRLLPQIQLWGNYASIGLAAGAEFHSSVMPFILRGVSILGVSSNNCPMPLRKELWKKLASEWKPKYLKEMLSDTISLSEVLKYSKMILDRKYSGRCVVKLTQDLKY